MSTRTNAEKDAGKEFRGVKWYHYVVDVFLYVQMPTTLEFLRGLGVTLDVEPSRKLCLAEVELLYEDGP